ncbi:cupin domain-containing protein [Pseudomarimonas salicorniae]|uniref:Cupin domain-containing protein n=1 Tax=Pseudomarimonas salicorniae TaxID=2933270 RepID=A0ABT0GMB2_9GAMM|nr:cupin domain-containing protein [Lysobacter sp. CAU 1642]MCK7595517.1 cupin domain-containing protein [Lysobacter sp. CAU 1642]
MPDAPPSLANCFAVLDPGLRMTPIPVSEGLYAELDRRFDGFSGHVLIAEHAFDSDWPCWERHPAGDELVVLLQGRARMRMRLADGDREVVLGHAGEYVIIPADIWHTAHIETPTRMLFVTPGEGTENREAPP